MISVSATVVAESVPAKNKELHLLYLIISVFYYCFPYKCGVVYDLYAIICAKHYK